MEFVTRGGQVMLPVVVDAMGHATKGSIPARLYDFVMGHPEAAKLFGRWLIECAPNLIVHIVRDGEKVRVLYLHPLVVRCWRVAKNACRLAWEWVSGWFRTPPVRGA